jgi:hypothetical protein
VFVLVRSFGTDFGNTYLLSPVTLLTTFLTMLGGRISSFKTFDSVANGNPLSSISSSNCKAKTTPQVASKYVPKIIEPTIRC